MLKQSNKNRKEKQEKVELVFPSYLPQQRSSDKWLIWSTGFIIFCVVLFIL